MRFVLAVYACVAVLGALSVGLMMYMSRGEHPESFYPTRGDAETAGLFERGWVPQRVMPESATNIREIHDLDTNHVWVRFDLGTSKKPVLPQGVRRLKPEEFRNVEIPTPYGRQEWWILPYELGSLGGRANVSVYEVREETTRTEARVGYLIVDSRFRTSHYYAEPPYL